MGLTDVTRAAVLAATAEYDRLGREDFLVRYGFGAAHSYVLLHDGHQYDSKAIVGVAHGFLPGEQALRPDKFSGGEQTVARLLRRLGFEVHAQRPPSWARDEVILACDLVARADWRWLTAEDPRVIELSDLLHALPLHPPERRGTKFRNPNGVARKTADIATHHPDYQGKPTKGGALDAEVLQAFLDRPEEMHAAAEAIRHGVAAGAFEDLDLGAELPDDAEAAEGKLLERRHFARERSPKLRKAKIRAVLDSGDDLRCEACGFDFKATYGEHGAGYIECHHVVPLHASGETKTRLADLALLCSNCHRMIHRRTPWLTPSELREKVTRARG